MAKTKKESVRRLECIQVQKDGVDYKIIPGYERMIVIRDAGEAEEGPPKVYYWDWLEVAEKLCNPEVKT